MNANLLKHYEMLIETYRHHFDLFIKGVAVYLLIISAVCGFMFSRESIANRQGLAWFVLGISLIGLNGLRPCYRWLRTISASCRKYEEVLELEEFDFNGARGIVDAVKWGMWTIAIGAIVLILTGL